MSSIYSPIPGRRSAPPHIIQSFSSHIRQNIQNNNNGHANENGKCTCCPHGFHISNDFINFPLYSPDSLTNLHRPKKSERFRTETRLVLEKPAISSDFIASDNNDDNLIIINADQLTVAWSDYLPSTNNNTSTSSNPALKLLKRQMAAVVERMRQLENQLEVHKSYKLKYINLIEKQDQQQHQPFSSQKFKTVGSQCKAIMRDVGISYLCDNAEDPNKKDTCTVAVQAVQTIKTCHKSVNSDIVIDKKMKSIGNLMQPQTKNSSNQTTEINMDSNNIYMKNIKVKSIGFNCQPEMRNANNQTTFNKISEVVKTKTIGTFYQPEFCNKASQTVDYFKEFVSTKNASTSIIIQKNNACNQTLDSQVVLPKVNIEKNTVGVLFKPQTVNISNQTEIYNFNTVTFEKGVQTFLELNGSKKSIGISIQPQTNTVSNQTEKVIEQIIIPSKTIDKAVQIEISNLIKDAVILKKEPIKLKTKNCLTQTISKYLINSSTNTAQTKRFDKAISTSFNLIANNCKCTNTEPVPERNSLSVQTDFYTFYETNQYFHACSNTDIVKCTDKSTLTINEAKNYPVSHSLRKNQGISISTNTDFIDNKLKTFHDKFVYTDLSTTTSKMDKSIETIEQSDTKLDKQVGTDRKRLINISINTDLITDSYKKICFDKSISVDLFKKNFKIIDSYVDKTTNTEIQEKKMSPITKPIVQLHKIIGTDKTLSINIATNTEVKPQIVQLNKSTITMAEVIKPKLENIYLHKQIATDIILLKSIETNTELVTAPKTILLDKSIWVDLPKNDLVKRNSIGSITEKPTTINSSSNTSQLVTVDKYSETLQPENNDQYVQVEEENDFIENLDMDDFEEIEADESSQENEQEVFITNENIEKKLQKRLTPLDVFSATPEDTSDESTTTQILGATESSLKSIMKSKIFDDSVNEIRQSQKNKGIKFAEPVNQERRLSDSDASSYSSHSSTSYDEACFDGREGVVEYKRKLQEQNIRTVYELPESCNEACKVFYSVIVDDSTEVVTENDFIEAMSILQKEWFRVSSHKTSEVTDVEDFLNSVSETSIDLLDKIVNLVDNNGNTALHYAISHSNVDIVNLLLDTDSCDVDKPNRAGYTSVMLAALAPLQTPKHLEVVKRLLSMGDVNAKSAQAGQTALMLAVSHGRSDTIKLLLEAGANINERDEDGSTALMCASEHGYLEIVKLLLSDSSLDATLMDNDGSTALSIAMDAKHKDIGVLLYAHINFKTTQTGKRILKRTSSLMTPPRGLWSPFRSPSTSSEHVAINNRRVFSNSNLQ